jgi:hypothetical protein
MDTIMREKKIINITKLFKKRLAERGLYKYDNIRVKEKHSIVEDGDLEIEGYQEKCRNWKLPHMQKGGGIEPHFEM